LALLHQKVGGKTHAEKARSLFHGLREVLCKVLLDCWTHLCRNAVLTACDQRTRRTLPLEGTLTVRRTSMGASCVAVYFGFIAVGTFLIFGIAKT